MQFDLKILRLYQSAIHNADIIDKSTFLLYTVKEKYKISTMRNCMINIFFTHNLLITKLFSPYRLIVVFEGKLTVLCITKLSCNFGYVKEFAYRQLMHSLFMVYGIDIKAISCIQISHILFFTYSCLTNHSGVMLSFIQTYVHIHLLHYCNFSYRFYVLPKQIVAF